MRRTTSTVYVGLFAAAAFATACGGDQTTAGKSAVGFDEAQRKGAATASPEPLAATLRPDPLDMPEPTALREAARAAEIAQQMAGGGHGMSHGTYRQIDAGREDIAPAPSGHEGHQMTPAPPPPSSADPHAGHSAPATQAAPAPSADPHAGHAKPAAPRPNPTPSPRPTPTPRPKQDNR